MSPFNSLRNRFRAALGHIDDEPDVQSENRRSFGFSSHRGELDKHRVSVKDTQKFWKQYQTCPLVRKSIDTWAEDVTAPGYRVGADNDELSDELEEWLSHAGIVAGESHRDFSEILHDALVQEEARGTSLVEVVPTKGDEDAIWGFRLVNVETVDALTYDDQAVLIRPDDTGGADVPTTERGEAAAYAQWSSGAYAGPFDESKETIYLSQNDIVKLTTGNDTSDIFGNSTIAPVSNEVEELNRMIRDTGEAVHSKGFPLWIFSLGSARGDVTDPRAGVWPEDKIKEYRNSHKEGEFSVSQKDFVPGDVDVERIEGEVPEIEELLQFLTEEIISAFKPPKVKISHADSVNRDISSEQLEQYQRQIADKRRRLESAFEPIIRRKARELGFPESDVRSVTLEIKEPQPDNPLARDDFDASEIAELSRAVNNVAGEETPNSAVVSPAEFRAMLGIEDLVDDEPSDDGGESEAIAGDALDEERFDEQAMEIAKQFEETYGEPITPDAPGATNQSYAQTDD
jgi:hypothetical protein